MPTTIKYALQSRKFWAAIVGLVMVVLTSWDAKPFPVDAVVTAIMGIVAAYMGAVALEDGLTARDSGTTKLSAPSGSNVTVVSSPQPQDVQSAPSDMTPAKPTIRPNLYE